MSFVFDDDTVTRRPGELPPQGRASDDETQVVSPRVQAALLSREVKPEPREVSRAASVNVTFRKEHPSTLRPLSASASKSARTPALSKSNPWQTALRLTLAGSLALGSGLLLAMLASAWTPPKSRPGRAEAVALPVPQPVQEQPRKRTLVDRARAGERAAVEELQKKPAAERSVLEVLALDRGRHEKERAVVAAWAESFLGKKKASFSSEEMTKILAWIRSERTSDIVLSFLSRAQSTRAPDLLHYLAERDSAVPEAVAQTARELLLTREVHGRMSRELRLALDAEQSVDCKGARVLLQRALEYGDRRSVRPMARFAQLTGCGGDGSKDCFPCLRRHPLLEKALNAAQLRPGPSFSRY